ncbi:MAG: hypothetical protein FWG90_06475 [Oscillospiraceae bacterium]|nr:hypothetical protein [Oscillospiraceae bacterium]
MKIKKILSLIMLCAFIMPLASNSIKAFAADSGDITMLAEVTVEKIEFYSIWQLESYLSAARNTGNTAGATGKFAEYLKTVDTIYHPESFDLYNAASVAYVTVNSITITSAEEPLIGGDIMIDFTAEVDGKRFLFKYYYDESSAKQRLALAKSHLGASAESKNMGDYTVYSYRFIGGRNYCWEQGGKVFELVSYDIEKPVESVNQHGNVSVSADDLTYDEVNFAICKAKEFRLTLMEIVEGDERYVGWGRYVGWIKDRESGEIYYISEDEENGKIYYFDSNGHALTKPTVINDFVYNFGSDGEYKREYIGWSRIGNDYFYSIYGMKIKGGWLSVGGYRYYLRASDGARVTGSQTINGQAYSFDDNGRLI